MRSIVFEGNTLDQYEKLRQNDKAAHKKLLQILKEMMRNNPGKGIGKPEPLRENYIGLWSRRLNQKDRLVYRFDDTHIYIMLIGTHYGDH